jgi:seryl-tRNA synthetase
LKNNVASTAASGQSENTALNSEVTDMSASLAKTKTQLTTVTANLDKTMSDLKTIMASPIVKNN